MTVDKEKYGLVFAGGGGKGGYEIGVWKALKESETLPIGAVSGTSVGALNAALYASGDYDKAEEIWLNISTNKILSPDTYSTDKMIKQLMYTIKSVIPMMSYPNSFGKAVGTIGKGVGTLGASVLVKKYVSNRGGMFSREGLVEIIQESGVLDKITRDSIPCYATCFNITHGRTQPFMLNMEGKDRITNILLASSAIPIAFPQEEIDGNKYYDGGIPFVGDNVPVKPLYELGIRKFIVVHLSRDGVDTFAEKFKNASFIHVFPKKDQGGFFDGTLDFDPKNARKRINEGYRDMKHQIEMLNNIDSLLLERNKRTEEIHIYSGKYYESLNSILDKSIELLDGTNSIENSEFTFSDLDKELSLLSDRMKSNKSEMDKFVLEGITHISAMDAQMNELHRAEGLKKIWNEISGKNKRLKQGIDSNLINAQQATTKMISKLVETDCMSIELIRTVQSQLQGATIKMGQILEQHGHEIIGIKDNYKEIVKLYGELVIKDQEIADELNNIYPIFFENEKLNEQRYSNFETELNQIKDVQRLQNWRMNIKYQTFNNTDYNMLDIVEKVICVASDFFYLTKGVWDDEILLFVKGALDSLEISPNEILSYNELVYKLIIDETLRDYLFERNGIRIHSSVNDDIVPHYEAVIDAICIGKRTFMDNGIEPKIWLSNYISDKIGGIDLVENTAFNIICELFVIMLQLKGNKVETDILPAYRDIKKAALLGDVEAECKYVNLLLEHNYIDEAFDMTLDMDSRMEKNSVFEEIKERVMCRYAANN